MTKIRISGTRKEIETTIEQLNKVLNIDSVSMFYPNRGSKTQGRVYIDVIGKKGENKWTLMK